MAKYKRICNVHNQNNNDQDKKVENGTSLVIRRRITNMNYVYIIDSEMNNNTSQIIAVSFLGVVVVLC